MLAGIHVYQPEITPDAMLFVHNRIAWPDFGQITQNGIGRSGFTCITRALSAYMCGIQFGFGNER